VNRGLGFALLAGGALAMLAASKKASAQEEEGGAGTPGGQDEQSSPSDWIILPGQTGASNINLYTYPQAQTAPAADTTLNGQAGALSAQFITPTLRQFTDANGAIVGYEDYEQGISTQSFTPASRGASGGSSRVSGDNFTPAPAGSGLMSFAVIGGAAGGAYVSEQGGKAAASFAANRGVDITSKNAVSSVLTDPYSVKAGISTATDIAADAAPSAGAKFLGRAAGFVPLVGIPLGAAADKYLTRNEPNAPGWWDAFAANAVGDAAQIGITAGGTAVTAGVGAPVAIGAGIVGGVAAQDAYYYKRGKSSIYGDFFGDTKTTDKGLVTDVKTQQAGSASNKKPSQKGVPVVQDPYLIASFENYSPVSLPAGGANPIPASFQSGRSASSSSVVTPQQAFSSATPGFSSQSGASISTQVTQNVPVLASPRGGGSNASSPKTTKTPSNSLAKARSGPQNTVQRTSNIKLKPSKKKK